MSDLLIKTEKLTHIYMKDTPFEKKAVLDIDLEITEGEIIGIIGPTGCGKSTLIQHFNGILTPTTGKVFVKGQDLSDSKTNLKLIRQKIGLLFQYPEHQLFEETIYKDIAFGPKNMGLSDGEIDDRVREVLEWAEIPYDESKERSPFNLSGGEMRKVALAGVLAMKPEVLVLDEPVSGLDPQTKNHLLSKIMELNEKFKITIVMVSHSMEEIAHLSDRIFVMYKGKIIEQGAPREIFKNSGKLKKLDLDLPVYTELMSELKESGFNVKTDVLTLEEAKQEILKLWSC